MAGKGAAVPAAGKKKTGRPRCMTIEQKEAICRAIVEGATLRHIEKMENMVSIDTILRELDRDLAFRGQYARARELQAERMAMEILDIADDSRNDWVERENGRGETELVPNQELVQRARLRVDSRKWLLSKMLPKKYGDSSVTQITGADGGPVQVATTVSLPALEAFAVKLRTMTEEPEQKVIEG